MESIVYRENEEKEVSFVTSELLERIHTVKRNSADSLIIGREKIFKGMDIFEGYLLAANPQEINDEIVQKIENVVDKHLIDWENEVQYIDSYIHYGVTICFTILETYNNLKKNGKNRTLAKY